MRARRPLRALAENFLGAAPGWYKLVIVGFLLTNPLLLVFAGPIVTGWAIVLEFIFTLAAALKCYPLQSGGLLVLEAVALGLASPASVYEETSRNLSVLLLLVFMVAGVYFLKELLLFVFTKLLLGVRSRVGLALLFCAVAAALSAFLDALTVTAVLVTIAQGFYAVYHKVVSGKQFHHDHDPASDDEVHELRRRDLDNFRAFLRALLMHAVVGTALGGMMTLVGEPQNLLIAQAVGWDFAEFFLRVAPVSLPVFAVGLGTCVALELGRAFGFGVSLPETVRSVLVEFDAEETRRRSARERAVLWVQASVAVMLVLALGLHLAEVGIVGLAVIVLATALNGVVEEKRLGRAFEEALPFTALLVVFFGVVAVIHEQHLFVPITERVLALDGRHQTAVLYLANGLLSAVSDNVFVASVYVNEVAQAFESGVIDREQFELLAVAINTGTNVPSVATPNGQAAFLFLLTSAIAPLIRLSYGRMVWMALPYAVTLTVTGLLAIVFLL